MLKIEKKEYQNRTFRLPVSVFERLGAVAQAKNMSVNNLVVTLGEYALDNLEPDDDSGSE